MRWRLLSITAIIVTIAVAFMLLLSYIAIATVVTRGFDDQLDARASMMIEKVHTADSRSEVVEDIEFFRAMHPEIHISVQDMGNPDEDRGSVTYNYGDSSAVDEYWNQSNTAVTTSIENIGPVRILAKSYPSGERVVLALELETMYKLISDLGAMLLAFAIGGIAVAIIGGIFVSSLGLRPLTRFQEAVDRITASGELRPIRVVGDDQLAQLTRSFNSMILALQEAQERQGRFVADAGHELKTPLTSIRTNIELLMMVPRRGVSMDADSLAELEDDVTVQLDEMARLINDLIGLARVEASDFVQEVFDLESLLTACVDRTRRTHPLVNFEVKSQSWYLRGNAVSLEHALVNLLVNAGNWSPSNGTVRVTLEETEDGGALVVVADEGPGIAVEERERVFDRFYRSAEARAKPGSGLGLAIVAQAVQRHSGSVFVEDSVTGGAALVIELPASLRINPADVVDNGIDKSFDQHRYF